MALRELEKWRFAAVHSERCWWMRSIKKGQINFQNWIIRSGWLKYKRFISNRLNKQLRSILAMKLVRQVVKRLVSIWLSCYNSYNTRGFFHFYVLCFAVRFFYSNDAATIDGEIKKISKNPSKRVNNGFEIKVSIKIL